MKTLRAFTILACALTSACGGAGPAQQSTASVIAANPAPTASFLAAKPAGLGSNTALLATTNTTLATMPAGTVLPLRQTMLDVLRLQATAMGDAGGATLTYKGNQTINGVTGPVFDLNVPLWAISVTLQPDGTGARCCDFNNVSGKALDILNYTLTAQWTADTDGSICGVCTAMAVTGFQTPDANVPASGQATYLGNGAAPNARGSVSGALYGGGGPATIIGASSNFSINFGTGQIGGTLAGLKAAPVSSDGVAGTPQDWNQINITGALAGAVLSGATSTPSQPLGSLGMSAGATGKIDGALYGPHGEELGAVWSLQDSKTNSTAFGVVSATKQ